MEWNNLLDQENQSFWGLLGMELISAEKQAVFIELNADDKHLNLGGIVHGGVLSAVMDQAMGILAATVKGRLGVTTHLNVQFLSPMHKGRLHVSAFPLHESYRTMTLRAEVRDADGVLGCISTATFRVPRT